MKQRSFGRRGEPQRQHSRGSVQAVAQSTRIESNDRSLVPPLLVSDTPEGSSLDDDLREWKLTRKQNFRVHGVPSRSWYLCFFVSPPLRCPIQ